jgi:hypothetical protein
MFKRWSLVHPLGRVEGSRSAPLKPPPGVSAKEVKPFEASTLRDDIKHVHHSAETKIRKSLIFLIICVVLLFLFVLGIYPEVTLCLSIFLFSSAMHSLLLEIKRRKSLEVPAPKPVALTLKSPLSGRPSDKFTKPAETVEYASSAEAESQAIVYKPYTQADRATSAINRTQFLLSADASIDQLASDAIHKLGISSTEFSQYLGNMKAFLTRSLLAKLAPELNSSDNQMIEDMVTVPKFEYAREYVIHRVRCLARTAYLAGHFGPSGDRWNGREFESQKLPSDNQIVLHILGTWLSFFMSGRRLSGRVRMIFHEKFIAIERREPRIEKETDLYLCSDDWKRFCVLTRWPQKGGLEQRFWAFPGIDGLYAALVLFFWFVKEKFDFALDGADLRDRPIFMERVFSPSRLDS